MPRAIRIVHSVALALGVSSSASTYIGCASGVSPIRGSYRLSILAKSTLVMVFSGSSVSALDPPVRPARSVPPLLGLPAVGMVFARVTLPVPHPLSSPPVSSPPAPAAPMVRPVLRKSLRLTVISFPGMFAPGCREALAAYESGCRGVLIKVPNDPVSSRYEHNVHNVI